MGKLNSTIWWYFKKKSDKVAECNLCLRSVKTSGNTTNAKNHLKTRHGIFIEGNAVVNPGPGSKEYGSGSISVSNFRIEECHPEEKVDLQKAHATDDEEVLSQVEETTHHDHQGFMQSIEKEDELEEPTEMYMLEDDDDISLEEAEVYEDSKSSATTYVLKRQKKKVTTPPPPPPPDPKTSDTSSSSVVPRYDFSSAVDLFFASMAATVKQMPPDKIVTIKQKISKLVFEEELKHLHHQSENLEFVQAD